VALYLLAAGREAWYLGRKMFFENLVSLGIEYLDKLFSE
jgi:hypothetical protein